MFSFARKIAEEQQLLQYETSSSNSLLDDEESQYIEKTAFSLNNGGFYSVPNEIIAFIASFLKIRDLANFNQVNQRIRNITNNVTVMAERIDEKTNEKEWIPALMISETDLGEKKPATYAQICNFLKDKAPQTRRLKELNNDFFDATIFRKKAMNAYYLPGAIFSLLGFCAAMPVVITNKSFGSSRDARTWIALLLMLGVPAVGFGLSIFCCKRNEKIYKEKKQLSSELGNILLLMDK